jgi:hypothetical protein
MKCKICGKEIEKGKYCILCEMKSQILFKGSVSDTVKKIAKGEKCGAKSK